MQRVFRPLAVFSIASGASLAAALQLAVGGAQGSDGPGFGTSTFFPGYDLAKLEIVEPTLYHVDESYVDPARIDWDSMYTAALDAVERRVPMAMFAREPGGNVVSVELGEFRTVLEVPEIDSRLELQEQLREIAGLVKQHLHPEDVPLPDGSTADPYAEIEYALINGMLSTLDPHSVLLPPEDAREMDVENQGEFGGLGITIEVADDGRLVISYPLKGTPADQAGLLPDDQIVRIDGESTINLSLEEAVRRLRGPVGAEVDLEIARKDLPRSFSVTIRREIISINPVEGKLLDGAIGYVSIKGFHEQVERSLHEELSKLNRDAGGEIDGLILDLRGNPGGFLNQAVKVADAFLESGDIVSTVDRDGRRADHEEARRTAEPMYPIAVLVDANSASASEIVAGALRYNERAIILGERTFGKGSVQNLHPFYDDSKLKLTISKYLTPGDRSLQAVGIPADIELEPTVIPPAGGPIRLYHRDRVRREADLDRSLERVTLQVDEPAYRIRYLESNQEKRRTDELDLSGDLQVQLARDILKAAPGWRRSDVLIGASPVVSRMQRLENDAFVRAFAERGIDWSAGPALSHHGAIVEILDTPPAMLDVKVDLGADGKLLAGSAEKVGVVVKNKGTQPVYRLVGLVTEHELLEGREFVFGLIPPGETRRYDLEVDVPDGWPSEQTPLVVDFRDAGEGSLGVVSTEVEVEGRPLPSFAWQWTASDTREGDGDGILDVGEIIDIGIEIQNVGTGPSSDAFARIRNLSRTALDPITATLSPGQPLDASGAACSGEPLPTGCRRVLLPGQKWTGAFAVQAKSALPDGAPLQVELTLGDARAYDQASVVRGGFYEWFGEREQIALVPGEPLPGSEQRRPPNIEVTRAPGPKVDSDRVTVSGVVTDDLGLRHVMVFVGEDKVFFEGAGKTSTLRTLPFTADVTLKDGSNVITVLATDDEGFVSSRSVVIHRTAKGIARLDEK
jgi:carboxyl-terminal processing protease